MKIIEQLLREYRKALVGSDLVKIARKLELGESIEMNIPVVITKQYATRQQEVQVNN